MSRVSTTLGAVGSALALSTVGELFAGELLAGNHGLIFWGGCVLALGLAAYGLPPWRRIWPTIRGGQQVGLQHDELRATAEQAGHWLEAMGTEGSGVIATEWFTENEPMLRVLLHATDPAADQVNDLAGVCDALETWYVRQRQGAALVELSERLATIGEQAHRGDLQQLAAVRAATAHRLLGDLAAARARLGMPASGPRDRITPAIRARRRLEQGLLNLARADQCAPGVDRDDAIRDARDCFDEAGLAAPRADLAADVAINLNLAVTYLYQHDPDTALDHLRLASARAAAAHDASANAHALELTGVAAWLQDNPREAVGWWRQAEQRYADIDERIGRARCLQHLGAAELANGRAAQAVALLEQSAFLLGGTAGHAILEHYLAQARASLAPAPGPAIQPVIPSRPHGLLTWLRRLRRQVFNSDPIQHERGQSERPAALIAESPAHRTRGQGVESRSTVAAPPAGGESGS